MLATCAVNNTRPTFRHECRSVQHVCIYTEVNESTQSKGGRANVSHLLAGSLSDEFSHAKLLKAAGELSEGGGR